MEERYNSQHTNVVQIEILGHNLQFTQDPNSKHVGTTIWDTSMVFVKFLEHNCKKGEFSNAKLRGKRVIELGSGCGLAGLGELGSIEVVELNWGDERHIATVEPPFDYIIGTDIVYKEDQLERLVSTLLALAGSKTSILLGYEYRSRTIHEKMLQLWKQHFEVKIVPRAKMDSKFQHESIQLFILRPKNEMLKVTRPKLSEDIKALEETQMPTLEPNEAYFEEHALMTTNAQPVLTVEKNIQYCQSKEINQHHETGSSISKSGVKDDNTADALDLKNGLNEWEARRLGSMAARLLHNVL